MAIPLSTEREIEGIARAGRVAATVLDELEAACVPGVRTDALDALARRLLAESGAESALLGYRSGLAPPFPAAICVSVNEVVLHGVPGARQVAPGDVVKLDLAVRCAGWYADAARTVVVPGATSAGAARQAISSRARSDNQALVGAKAALGVQACLSAATRAIGPGVAWRDVAGAVAEAAKRAEVNIVPGFDGHGIGRALHEAPRLALGSDASERLVLRPGMVLAVEPTVVEGGVELITDVDGWSTRTADGGIGAHAEDTVAILPGGVRILTRSG